MKCIVPTLALMLWYATSFCQLKCSSEKYTTIQLADGRTIYKKTIQRPPKCMDCASGVQYVDSACNKVASFIIGITVRVTIKEGYSINDFAEGKIPKFKSAYERANNAVSYLFSKPQGFLIKKVFAKELSFFIEGDSLNISNQNGMLHFKNGNLINSYKIIPRQIIVLYNNIPQKTIAYYLHTLKRYFFIKDKNGRPILMLMVNETEEHTMPSETKEENWEKAVLLQKEPS